MHLTGLHGTALSFLLILLGPDPPPPTSVCPNLSGSYAAVPAGYTRIEGLCLLTADIVVVEPPVPPSTTSAPIHKKPPKVKVSLRCSPRIGSTAGPFQPAHYFAFLRVENPGEAFWCPEVNWLIDGAKTSGHESDCTPYESVRSQTGEAPTLWEEPPKDFWLPSGEYRIVAKLLKSGRIIGEDSCTVYTP